MPPLPNARHELFAQNLARGMTHEAAYEAAGYRRHAGHASALAGEDRVAARVAELQSRVAERAVITAVRLIELAEEARLLAMENNQASAAISAIREMAALAGLRAEKPEPVKGLDEMSDAELTEIVRGGAVLPDMPPGSSTH
jgi:phage terminase small subunit